MASPDQRLPAEVDIGAGAFMGSTRTGLVTSLSGRNEEAEPIPDLDVSGMTPSAPGQHGDSGDDAGEASSGTTSPASASKDQFLVLSRIKKLQDELIKLERGARQEAELEHIERKWDSMFERVGGDAEQRKWAEMQERKAQSFAKDTTAFAFGREWVHESEGSFIRLMMEREEFNKQLIQRRAQWEAKKGIEQLKFDRSQKPAWAQSDPHRLFTTPAFLDPMSQEAMFNNTDTAQGYDLREAQLRSHIHELLRGKYRSFVAWKQNMTSRQRMAPDPKLADLWPRPAANYVQWETYITKSPAEAFGSEEKQHLFALDVLDGEPDTGQTGNPVAVRTMQNNRVITPFAVPRLAEGLVPERIRLNGPQFSESFRDWGPLLFLNKRFSAEQMTLLQPYRLLIYHEQRIRDRHEALKKKFGIPGDHEDTPPGDSTQISGNRSTVQDDAQQEDATRNATTSESEEGSEDSSGEETLFPLANSKTAMSYLGCLIDFMDSTISIRRKHVQGTECRKVHFRDLWYLFSPGDEVIRRDGKQAYRVIEVVNPVHSSSLSNVFFDYLDETDTSRYFQLSCAHVDFDGKRFGPISTTFVIKMFAGERTVESLEVYPLRLHHHASTSPDQSSMDRFPSSDSRTLRQELIKRGKTFFRAACMKMENAFYDGQTMDGEEVESQVVVDFEMALSSDENLNGGSVPEIKSLLDDPEEIINDDDKAICLGPCCVKQFICDDRFVDKKRREEYIDSLIPKTYGKLPSVAVYPRNLEDTTGENALTEDEFLLMSYRVFAFVLRTRKWAELDLTYMEDAAEDNVQTNENKGALQSAFERLVLPEGHQNIVLSLISQHFRNKDSGRHNVEYSDIVRGKGLILLLHGAPGVGKTSTAEGIAEMFKKPLFTITCGDLGSTAKEVEQALDLNFNLANRWGCILLLDEADVFLSSRTETDFERNGLVAVFLRVLEYYAGVLFLTTNRVGVIDEAFRSRIHISLYYPPLGLNETRAVFRLNLKLIQDRFTNDKRNIKIDQEDIIDYALDYFNTNDKARWNGRQIRNACQTALALAEFQAQGGNHGTILNPNADVHLAVGSFKTVSKAYLEFTQYLKQLYGIHEDVRAKELGLRAPETGRQQQAQYMQPPVFGGHVTQPGSYYGHVQPYSSAPVNPVQTGHGQPYRPAAMMGQGQINPSVGTQQPGQHLGHHSNPEQLRPSGSFNTHGDSGQARSGQIPQQGQEFGGMQFQPVQVGINQQPQPWMGQTSPLNSAPLPQLHSAQAQQQSHAPLQQIPGTALLGSQIPTSQGSQAPQSMTPQQSMQQQAPQMWYHNMNVQNLQPPGGQNPPGPSHQEGS